jgi:phage-related protein
MDEPWVVEFYQTAAGRPVLLDEVEALMTARQLAKFREAITKLEEHGRRLDGDYFDTVRGSKAGLVEFRLTLDRVDFRLLFVQQARRTFLMLVAYKEKRGDIPRPMIRTAEQRLKDWRDRHDEN